MTPLSQLGTVTMWDTNNHSITLRNTTYEQWLTIEGAIRADTTVSFTVYGSAEENYSSNQIQYGKGHIVRAEFMVHK